MSDEGLAPTARVARRVSRLMVQMRTTSSESQLFERATIPMRLEHLIGEAREVRGSCPGLESAAP